MKAYLFLAEGFEEIEAIAVIDILRRAQVDLLTVSVTEKKEVCAAHGITIIADMVFDEAFLGDAEILILPGGSPGTGNLKAHKGLNQLIIEYREKDKWLAAICAAPTIFARLGLLNGREATCYPACEADLSGAVYKTSAVVQDGKIITSRGAGTAVEFALKLVEVLKSRELSEKLRKSIIA